MGLDRITENGVVYFKVRIYCKMCLDNGLNKSSSFFTHSDCGGNIYIGSNGYVLCDKCHLKEHQSKWLFNFGCAHRKYNIGIDTATVSYPNNKYVTTHIAWDIRVEDVGFDWLVDYLKNSNTQ